MGSRRGAGSQRGADSRTPPTTPTHSPHRDAILAILARDGVVYRRALAAALPLPSHQIQQVLECFAVIDKKGRCWRLKRPADPTFELTYRDAADEQAKGWAVRRRELRDLIATYDASVGEGRGASMS